MGKNISISALDKVIKENYEQYVTVDWFGNELTIKKNISVDDAFSFVEGVAESCFTSDGNYIPEARDFAIRYNVIRLYTNVTLPSDNNHRYKILYCTNLFDVVVNEIINCGDQYFSIMNAINEKISYKANSNIEAITKSFNKLSDDIAEIANKSKSLFDGVTSEDVKGVFAAMSDGHIDESKLMEVYLNKKEE